MKIRAIVKKPGGRLHCAENQQHEERYAEALRRLF